MKLFDKVVDFIATSVCGWLGHDYIREASGFTYCRHCGFVVKDRD